MNEAKKNFFFRKKNSKWPTQKKLIFQNRQFSKFFRENFSDLSLGYTVCNLMIFLEFGRAGARTTTNLLNYSNLDILLTGQKGTDRTRIRTGDLEV